VAKLPGRGIGDRGVEHRGHLAQQAQRFGQLDRPEIRGIHAVRLVG